MMEMKEQTGSRKKYLAPVVVLMLCLVALTGAAYAYSSTMTNTGNAVDADVLSLDLSTPGTPTDSVHSVAGAVVFTDNFAYTALAEKTNVVKSDITSKLICTYDLTISGDATANKLIVSSSDIDALYTKAVGTKTVGALFKIKVNTTDDLATAKDLKATPTAEEQFTINKTTAVLENLHVYIYIQALDDTPAAVGHCEKTIYSGNANTAQTYANLFNTADYKFTLSFQAVGPTTA